MNVPNYRIGSDLPISFFVEIHDEENEETAILPEDTIITLRDPYGRPIDIEWTINERNVSARFPGPMQKMVGIYTVEVVVNQGKEGMVTADRQLFRLVAHSWETGPIAEGVIIDISDMENPCGRDVIDAVKWLVVQEHEQNQRIDSAQQAAEAATDGIEAARAAADKANEDIDKTTMRVYRDGGYNMDRCLWYGHYFGCTLGRPEGSKEDETYALEVVNAGVTIIDEKGYMVVKQICHSDIDKDKVYHRLIYTQNRTVYEPPTTIHTRWSPIDEAIQNELDTKVDSEAGKGLSSNDFTNEEKLKLQELTAIPLESIDDLCK